jgi:cyclopropane-fatty-acyl-phospholipid synthase
MLLSRSDLSLCEAFIYGDITVEGDLSGLFAVRDYLEKLRLNPQRLARLAWLWLRLPRDHRQQPATCSRLPAHLTGRRHSVRRDRKAIAYHYDLSNEFYATWLDRRMVYSCAYFPTGTEDLNTAQESKLDYICRKLRLRSGERLLDIGCGWGGLIIYAAKHYGVHAVGITLSKNQHRLAQERVRSAGLEDRCSVELLDYREVDLEQPFDKVVSVGMFEHVGREKLPIYFSRAWQMLKPGGLFLNHGIGGRATERARLKSEFIDTYVFPDGELFDIGLTLGDAEQAGFEIIDVESLRPHYALTLRHWVSRLEADQKEALRYVDEPTFRVWQLFMSGAAYYFDIGRLNVYQTLLWKPTAEGHHHVPWSRADLYRGFNRDQEILSKSIERHLDRQTEQAKENHHG